MFDAYLGSGLYKQRIARKGQGKRSSYRTILAFKEKSRSVFMYGYAKSNRANISNKEEVYKKLAGYYLELSDNKLEAVIKLGELIEVK